MRKFCLLAAFASLGVRRRIFIHLNNTNPVLLADSPERATVTAAGWDVAEDGMRCVRSLCARRRSASVTTGKSIRYTSAESLRNV